MKVSCTVRYMVLLGAACRCVIQYKVGNMPCASREPWVRSGTFAPKCEDARRPIQQYVYSTSRVPVIFVTGHGGMG